MVQHEFPLRVLRKKRDLTQNNVAKSLDITRTHYCLIEKNISKPGLILGLKIAKFFNVDPYELFTID